MKRYMYRERDHEKPEKLIVTICFAILWLAKTGSLCRKH
jgi:hypothetical protein